MNGLTVELHVTKMIEMISAVSPRLWLELKCIIA